jgi:hypothetical protein
VLDSFFNPEFPGLLRGASDFSPSGNPVDGGDKGSGRPASDDAPLDLELEGLAPPEILHRVEPAYPVMARELGLAETVTAELMVGNEGFVREVKILGSRSGVFNDEVRAAIEGMDFPAPNSGRAGSLLSLPANGQFPPCAIKGERPDRRKRGPKGGESGRCQRKRSG